MATTINSVKKKPGDLIIFSDSRSVYDNDGDYYTVMPGDVALVVAINSLSAERSAVAEYTVLLGNIILHYLEDGSHDQYY